jgi:putative DNA primase/helicase
MTQTPNYGAIALSYAARGWRVHPLRKGDKLPATAHGCKDATLDADQIRKWWSMWPDANIGLATGYGFWVLDIDPDGLAWAEANDLPATIEATTGRGGRHLLYRLPEGATVRNSAGVIAPGVDVRGAGGYIVAAPSLHPSGTRYTWLDCDGDVPDGDPADAPAWLLDMVTRGAQGAAGEAFKLPEVIPEGGRDNTLFSFASSLRAQGFGAAEIRAALGVANARCVPPLTEKDLDRITGSACKYNPGLSPEFAAKRAEGRGWAREDAPPTRGGWASGVEHETAMVGWPVPAEVAAAHGGAEAAAVESSPFGEVGESGAGAQVINADFVRADVEVPVKLVPNAVGDAIINRVKIMNVDSYLYEYDGTHWRSITTERLRSLALQADGTYHTTAARRSEIADYIKGRSHCDRVDWRQTEQWEVPVLDGVIDVRTMRQRAHRPEDLLQACPPVAYRASAQCPMWMRCLDTYFGGDDDEAAKVDALQEFFGYCLMPHARYKKALICFGESDCGKSTIPYVLRLLVGAENIACVGVEDMDDPRKRAPLLGKMLNILTELTSDAMVADGGFKTLVSTEEPIQFDPKYLPPVMDTPATKHIIVTNQLPHINDRSRGTYNRLLVIKFEHVIPKAEQDRQIWEKLEQEAEGILLWALEGAARLIEQNGRFTSAGEAEVEEYRRRQNPLLEFLTECGEADEDGRVLLSVLRAKFSEWYGRGGVRPQALASWAKSAGIEVSDRKEYVGGSRGIVIRGWRLDG